MTYHDFEVFFAAFVLGYSISVMLSLSIRAMYFSLEKLLQEWMER